MQLLPIVYSVAMEKIVATVLFICALYNNESGLLVRGQYFEDPTRHFMKLSMDLAHRGSFNNTDCLRDLLNCWEVIRPDLICSKWVVFESVCGLIRRDCTEKHGWLNADRVPIFESFCDY